MEEGTSFTVVPGYRSQSGEGIFTFKCEDATSITNAIYRHLEKLKINCHEAAGNLNPFADSGKADTQTSLFSFINSKYSRVTPLSIKNLLILSGLPFQRNLKKIFCKFLKIYCGGS